MNSIYIRRRSKIHVPAGEGQSSPTQIATLQKEISQLGFVLSEKAATRLMTLDAIQLASTSRHLLRELQQMMGAHVQHHPLYPGFPEQVMRASDAELYLNSIAHYLTLRRLPADRDARPVLLDGRSPRILDLGTVEDFGAIFTQLTKAASSLSTQDREDVAWFIRQYREQIIHLLPTKFLSKETLALVAAQLLQHVPGEVSSAFVRDHCVTPTDLLRVAAALFNGDASLALPTKYGRLSRTWRHLVLGALDQMPRQLEDMLRWAERWKRLGERLHPGEFGKRYSNAHAAFMSLRCGITPQTFNSRLEAVLAKGDVELAAGFLEERPGEYARKLDVLLRSPQATPALAHKFAELAPRVATSVLLQVLTHFRHRGAASSIRAFIPKGEMAKIFVCEDKRPPVPDVLATIIVNATEQALIQRFAALPRLGRSYIDPALRSCMVPLAQRSASKSLRTLARGSRLPLPQSEVIRLFLWWKNGNGRTDIDLSAALFDDRYRLVEALAFYNLRGADSCGVHSGDIVDAPQGAAEFIDLDLMRVRARGARFVVMCLNSYTAQAYCDLPECFAGWMSREHPGSGEVFEPRTVVDKVDIGANTRICLPLILDLQRQEALWTDLALTEHPNWYNTVAGNEGRISLMLRAMNETVRPDLFTLFDLHVRARGERVDNPADAHSVFSMREGVTPTSVDEIRAGFL